MTSSFTFWSHFWTTSVFFASLIISPFPGSGQTHRYWANNFNEEAFLLSGAVVAGNTGSGAIYYNPAAITNIKSSRLSLNSNIVSYQNIRLEQALGENYDVKFSTVNILPSFFSLLLKSPKNPNLTFEFGLLSRERTRIEINDGLNGRGAYLEGFSGEQIYDTRVEYLVDYNDDWVGFGAGYQVNEKLSAGASMFFILRNFSYKYLFDANLFPANDAVYYEDQPLPYFVSNSMLRENLKFFQIRFIWKFGLVYATDRWSVGFNLTTPSVPIKLFATSNASKKISYSNIWEESGSFAPDFIIVDQQKKQPVNLKDPLSVSLGLRFNTADLRHTYYTTVEYFSSLDPYKMFNAEINPDIASAEIFEALPRKDFLSFYSAANAVFNMALGYRYRLNERTSILGGFRTDFNYLKDFDFSEQAIRPKNININAYHLTSGSMFSIRSNAFILGAQFSFGNQENLPQVGSIPIPGNPINPPIPENGEETMNVRMRTISLFVGFNINLSKNRAGKDE